MQFISKCCRSLVAVKYDHYVCMNCQKKLRADEVEFIKKKKKSK